MAKDFIINTSSLNSWGTRILTAGIDLTQFKRNPVLLYMHRRGYDGDGTTPIGRVENLRIEGDELRGTPVFDLNDTFGAELARKWDEDFLRMCSAGVEPIELSSAPEDLLPGQSRATVVRSKLIEVSIVDIGSNDDALQLYQSGGKILQLAAGIDNDFLPLLKAENTPATDDPALGKTNNKQNNLSMDKILLTLGLPATATETDAVNAIAKLQANAQKADTIELARITTAVDDAIKANKTTADKREHLITLGKQLGFDGLQTTLTMLTPAQKPNDIVRQSGGAAAASGAIELAYGSMSAEQLKELRENNRPEYIRLYKAEFGFVPEIEK